MLNEKTENAASHFISLKYVLETDVYKQALYEGRGE